VKDGPYLGFDADGKLRVAGAFRDGKRDGTWRSFDSEGHLSAEERYDFGSRAPGPSAEAPSPTAPTPSTPGPPPAKPPTRSGKSSDSRKIDDLESNEPGKSSKWDAGRVGVQFTFGLIGTALAAAVAVGGVLIANASCGDPKITGFKSNRSTCQDWVIGSSFVAAYIPLSALGVWIGGNIMGGRGTYPWTLAGSAINILLLALPSAIGWVTAGFSAGQIIMYHESELPPSGDFLAGPNARSSLVRVGGSGLSFDVPSVGIHRFGPSRGDVGALVPLLSLDL
jgi:hypothetical protein